MGGYMNKISKYFLLTAFTCSIFSLYGEFPSQSEGNQRRMQGTKSTGSFQRDGQTRTHTHGMDDQENQRRSDSQTHDNNPQNFRNDSESERDRRLLSQSNYPINPSQGATVGSQGTSAGNLDDTIVNQVHEKIAQDDYLSEGAKKVQVSSTDGNVGIKGTVHSMEEKRRLESLAKGISGVQKVSTNLEIK